MGNQQGGSFSFYSEEVMMGFGRNWNESWMIVFRKREGHLVVCKQLCYEPPARPISEEPSLI